MLSENLPALLQVGFRKSATIEIAEQQVISVLKMRSLPHIRGNPGSNGLVAGR